jgi:hypothetical protein
MAYRIPYREEAPAAIGLVERFVAMRAEEGGAHPRDGGGHARKIDGDLVGEAVGGPQGPATIRGALRLVKARAGC